MNTSKVTEPPGKTAERLIGQNREFESESHARSYARFRPRYSSEVVETMINYCKEGSTGDGLKLALDLGCGSGQSTESLAAYFDKVIGVEVSPNQHAEAQKSPTKPTNVTYRLGPGEDLSFQPDGSVDMISIAQAVHWFDLQTLYGEVRRVLRPGGLFAAYSYKLDKLDNTKGTELVEKWYVDPLGPYWHEKIRLLDDSYRDIQAPFPDDKRINHMMSRDTTLDQAVEYFTSWSAYQSYMRAHPDSTILEDLEKRLLKVYLESEADSEVKQSSEIKLYVDCLGPYWHEKVQLILDSYRDIRAPFSDDKRSKKHFLSGDTTLDQVVGYLTTLSSYRSFMNAHPNSDIMKDFAKRLVNVDLEAETEVKKSTEIKVAMRFPVVMIMSKKPKD